MSTDEQDRGEVVTLERELEGQARDLLVRIRDGRDQLERLRTLAESVESSVRRDEQLLAQLQSVLPSAMAPALDTLDERLRGARLREVALQVLASRAQPGEPVHYREWYSWVRADGFSVAGQDPLATFLAQITRAEGVQRIGGARSGRYALAAN